MLYSKEQKRQKLIKDLNSLCDNVLRPEYSVNSGGCLYVAYSISKLLDKRNINWELVLFCDTDYLNTDLHNLDIEYYNEHVSHYAIDIPNLGIINANNYWFQKYHDFYVSNINHFDLLHVYRNLSWNDVYETKNNITVYRLIKEVFVKYEN